MRTRLLLSAFASCGIWSSIVVADDAAQAIQPADPALGREVDFNMDVFPILQGKCLACHNRTTAESDLVLENVDAILKGGGSGVCVVAGKPDESLLYKAAARAAEPFMPPLPNTVAAKSLTPQELGILRKWIEEGAKPGQSVAGDAGLNWQPIADSIHAVFSLALEPRARFLAAGRVNRIAVFDLATKREVAQLSDPALAAIQRDGAAMYPAGAAHRDFVHALAISPDGNLIASSGYREIKLWERQRNVQLQKLAADAPVTAIAVSADGTQGATGLANGSIVLWNLATGAKGATLAGHTAAVNGLAFSKDAALLISGGEDATIRTWKLADGQPAATATTPAPIRALVLNADGTQVITGHADSPIRVWPLPQPDVATAVIREIAGHTGAVNSLTLLAGSNEILSGSDDMSVRIWKLDTGEQAFTQNLTGAVTSVAVTPDGQFVAGGDAAGIARVWNRAANQQVAEVKGNPDLDYAATQAADNHQVAKDKQGLADAALKEADKDVTSRDESLKKANEQKAAADKTLAEAEPKVVAAQQALDAAAKELEAAPNDEAIKKKKTDAEAALKKETEARDKAKEGVVSAERAIKLSQEALRRFYRAGRRKEGRWNRRRRPRPRRNRRRNPPRMQPPRPGRQSAA
ncbi:MAG: c-type cytochrome domain-containing protein [Planctomycetaceae bacterium]